MNKINLKLIFGTLGILTILFAICNPVFAEERISDFELEIQGSKIVEIAPGETVNFKALVKNNGNMLENFSIAIDKEYMKDGLPDGWNIEFGQTDFNISAGSERNININVTSNESSDFGDYEIYINVTSKDNESAQASVDNCTVRISFYKPDIIGDTHLNANTGNFVIYEEFNLSLKNRGSAKDVISSEIKSVDSPLAANWEGATPEEFLESNESSGNYLLRVRIPERTPYNDEKDYEIQLYVNSSKDPTKNEIVIITVFVEKYFDVKVTKERLVFVTPGSKDYVNFIVENTGNIEDDYSVAMKGNITYIDLVTAEMFTLVSGEKRNITALIDPPEEMLEKNWWINITTKSENSQGEMGYSVKVKSHLNITLKPYFKPEFVGETMIFVEPDGESSIFGSFIFKLLNDGSDSDTISFSIFNVNETLSVWWNGPLPFKTLNPGELSPEYEILVMIPPNTPYGMYNLKIWINSTNDPIKNKLVNLTVNIEIFYDISTSILTETVSIKLEPPYEAIFEVNITNEGNKNMDLRLKYQSGLEPRWNTDPGTVGRLLQDMKPGETRTAQIRITVDDEAEAKLYKSIFFRAYPEENEPKYEEIELNVNVEEFRSIRVNYASPTTRTVKPVDGQNKVTIPIGVYNYGNVEEDIFLQVLPEFYITNPDAIMWDIGFYSNAGMDELITSVEVQPNDVKTVYLGVELPYDVDYRGYVDAGSYEIPILGKSKEQININSSENIPLIIVEISEVNIDYVQGIKKIDPGDTESFIVKINNYGNKRTEMMFDIIDENVWAQPIDEEYKKEMMPGEYREIKINISIPKIDDDLKAEAGNYEIIFKVKPEGGDAKEINLPFEINQDYGCKIDIIDKIKVFV